MRILFVCYIGELTIIVLKALETIKRNLIDKVI